MSRLQMKHLVHFFSIQRGSCVISESEFKKLSHLSLYPVYRSCIGQGAQLCLPERMWRAPDPTITTVKEKHQAGAAASGAASRHRAAGTVLSLNPHAQTAPCRSSPWYLKMIVWR